MIEFKHLRLLQAVEATGTLSGASKRLGLSQPAVTQQVQSLERHLGTPLLLRARSGTRLTDAGRVVLKHGSSAIAAMSLAESEVSAIAGLRAGLVRVAAFPSAASSIVATGMARMRARNPGVSFTLHEAEPPESLEMLRQGECDIAVVFQWSNSERMTGDDVSWIPLVQEDVHLVFSAESPPTGITDAEIDLEDLWDAQWIAGCPKCRGHLLLACESAGFTPNILFEVDDFVTMQSLAARGLGVALLPDLILASVRVDGLGTRRLSTPTYRTVSAVSTPELERVPTVRAALKSLRLAAKEISAATTAAESQLNISLSPLVSTGSSSPD